MNWQRQWKSKRKEKGWRTQSRLIFFPLSYPFLFFLSGYVTGGFINHHLDSLCQGELTAFGPIRRCRDNRSSTSCASMPGAKHCLPVITYRKGKINPYQLPCFPPLIRGFCGVPGAWQTIKDIITSALIFFKESRVSPSNLKKLQFGSGPIKMPPALEGGCRVGGNGGTDLTVRMLPFFFFKRQ